jgi:hypothetical protein
VKALQALLFLKLDWVPLLSLGLSRSGLLAFVTDVFVSKRPFALPKHSAFCLAFVGFFLTTAHPSSFLLSSTHPHFLSSAGKKKVCGPAETSPSKKPACL